MSIPVAYRGQGLHLDGSIGLRLQADGLANPSAQPFNSGGSPTWFAIRFLVKWAGDAPAVLISSGSTRGWGVWFNNLSNVPKLIFAMASGGTAGTRYACSCTCLVNQWMDGYIAVDSSLGTPQMNINNAARSVSESVASSSTIPLELPADTAADKAVLLFAGLGSNQNVIDSVSQSAGCAGITGAASEWTNSAACNPFHGDVAYISTFCQGGNNLELPLAPGYGYGGTTPTDSTGLNTDPRWVTTGGVQSAGVPLPPGVTWKTFGSVWRERPNRPRCMMAVR